MSNKKEEQKTAEEILRKHMEAESIKCGDGPISDEDMELGREEGALQIALDAMEEYASLKVQSEVSRLSERNKELTEALKEARSHIATQIRSIQYQHAPREYGMIECAKLADKVVSESSIIQEIDQALNPKP